MQVRAFEIYIPLSFVRLNFIMPPTLKKLKERIALGFSVLPSVRPSFRPIQI